MSADGNESKRGHTESMALVQRDFELWNTGDLSIADEIYAPEYVGHFVASREWKGIEELKKEITRLRRNMPDRKVRIDDTVEEGEKVAVRFTSMGTHTSMFLGFPATGAKLSFPAVVIYRIANGKIVETWEYPDWQEARRQIELAQQAQKKG